MVSATEKKRRGRPDVFSVYYGERAGSQRELYRNLWSGCEARTLANSVYANEGLRIAEAELGRDGAMTAFYGKRGRGKGVCVLEQVGRMSLQNGYSEADCAEILRAAISFRADGYTAKQVARWIRRGRNSGEF